MNRLGIYAAGIALLSAISLPATAVMFRAAPTGDAQAAAVNVSPAPVDKSSVPSPALSPEGKPIRVISLQTSGGLQTDAPAPTVARAAAPPVVKPIIQLAEQPVVAPEPQKIMSSVPKHVSSARRATRPASASGKGLVALSSLY
jgi:hypothetical protein